MTEKKKRKKIAKLAVKLYLAEVAGGGYPVSEGCLKEAEKIVNENDRYINEASEPEPSTEQIEPETDSLDLSWAKWVAADENGEVYAYKEKPSRDEGEWRFIGSMSWQFSPHEHDIVIALCGRLPKWEDEEPTPVKNK